MYQRALRGPALRFVFVCTHKTITKGRSIFSRSTGNGSAFSQSFRVQPRSQEKCRPSVCSDQVRSGADARNNLDEAVEHGPEYILEDLETAATRLSAIIPIGGKCPRRREVSTMAGGCRSQEAALVAKNERHVYLGTKEMNKLALSTESSCFSRAPAGPRQTRRVGS